MADVVYQNLTQPELQVGQFQFSGGILRIEDEFSQATFALLVAALPEEIRDQITIIEGGGPITGPVNLFEFFNVANLFSELDTPEKKEGARINLGVDAGGGGGGSLPAGGVTNQVLAKLSAVDGDADWITPTKGLVGLAAVDNTSDINKPVSTAQGLLIATKEATIAAGTVGQYWRGDKSWRTLDKTAVGLANVDNTSDVNKPISTATAAALALKANDSDVDALVAVVDGKLQKNQNLADLTSAATARGNLGLGSAALAAAGDFATDDHIHANAVANGAAGFLSGADKAKLDGVAAGATANDTDAELRDRATHTGTQIAATISDLSESVRDIIAAALVAGANVTITPNDVADTITIEAAAGGGGGGGTITRRYTAHGTWTKPAGLVAIRVVGHAGGGGGGGGATRALDAFNAVGGGGGASGAHFDIMIDAADLPATVPFEVGAAGIGGAGGVIEGGGAGNGSAGGWTTFGASGAATRHVASGGGGGGTGGTAASAGGNGGTPPGGQWRGVTGGSAGQTAGGNGAYGASGGAIAGSGGAGGTLRGSDDSVWNGGDGSFNASRTGSNFPQNNLSNGGGVTGTNPLHGGAGNDSPDLFSGGWGGGGGKSSKTGPGGNGGNGGFPGGGAGGGGGARTGVGKGGDGGNGGAGSLMIIEFY